MNGIFWLAFNLLLAKCHTIFHLSRGAIHVARRELLTNLARATFTTQRSKGSPEIKR